MKIFNFIPPSHFKIFMLSFFQPNLLNPNLIVRDISQINFKYLHEIGIKYLVFDKDNTLTITEHSNIYNNSIQIALERAKHIFGIKNISILSNSILDPKIKFNFL